MIFLIIFLIGLIILLGFFFNYKFNLNFLIDRFKNGNVIVYGSKGSGKDLLFQKIINVRKSPYFSNINFGKAFNNFDFSYIDLTPNTFERMIDGDHTSLENKDVLFKKDIYISDGGIYLPAQYDKLLNNKYKSFALSYALSRHLWENNIHCNTQNLERIWKMLREQADTYIKCRKTIKLPFLLLTIYTIYDRYQSAINDIRPIKSRRLNKFSKAETDIYKSSNGLVKQGFIIQRKKSIKYDSFIFRKILLKKSSDKR